MSNYEYDVAISFAGAQRAEAREIAAGLKQRGISVFYDEYETANLWGTDLNEDLTEVYQHRARYCLMLISSAYSKRVWTTVERRSAQARAIKQKGSYILPVRFDDTALPGMNDTVSYVNFADYGVDGIVALVATKLRPSSSAEPTNNTRQMSGARSGPALLEAEAPLAAQQFKDVLATLSFFVVTGEAQSRHRAPDYIRLVAAVPHAPARLLDEEAQRSFRKAVKAAFREAGDFERQVRGRYFQLSSERSYRSSGHRVWSIWDSGAIGYTAALDRRKDHPLGDLLLHYIFFLRLIEGFVAGPATVILDAELSTPNVRFRSIVPDPEGEPSDYDEVRGVTFGERHVYLKDSDSQRLTLSLPTSDLVSMIAGLTLYQLQETAGASIRRDALETVIADLLRQTLAPAWGRPTN